jgi:hypothetical protein
LKKRRKKKRRKKSKENDQEKRKKRAYNDQILSRWQKGRSGFGKKSF